MARYFIQAIGPILFHPVHTVSMQTATSECECLPWQIVLSFNGQIGRRSLLPTSVVRAELEVLGGRIGIHIIFVVGHDEGVQYGQYWGAKGQLNWT